MELTPGMYDEFYGKLQRWQWHRRLTRLPEKQINVTLVKEFYANIYYLEDGVPKQCRVQGSNFRFDD